MPDPPFRAGTVRRHGGAATRGGEVFTGCPRPRPIDAPVASMRISSEAGKVRIVLRPFDTPIVKLVVSAVASAVVAVSLAGCGDDDDAVPRPIVHYAAGEGWLNDPNGLVFADGVYHLFYQYNPRGTTWGNISWGHATSQDGVRFEEQPVALAATDDEFVFSGSAVRDDANSSGLGQSGTPPLVAVYTRADRSDGIQAQALASSTDGGRTWTRTPGGPVLDIGSREFRDPKVFWHEPTQRWVMAVARSDLRQVSLYGSTNLREWSHLSDFGPTGATGGVWECPDLFPLPVDGDPTRQRWVLIASLNPGGPAGGSGAQYFVGEFDGTRFVADEPSQEPRWLDHGPDFYAPVSWNDQPGDEQRIVGWMSNWRYAERTPAGKWRGAMSVPRRLELRSRDGRDILVQQPVGEFERLRRDLVARRGVDVGPGLGSVEVAPGGRAVEVDTTVTLAPSGRVDVTVRFGPTDKATVSYDAARQEIALDRTGAGRVNFHPEFAAVYRAPLASRDGQVRLRIVVDTTSVEVFGGDGDVVLTAQIFPSADAEPVVDVTADTPARIDRLDAWRLDSSG